MGRMALAKAENGAVYLCMVYKNAYFVSAELNVSDIILFLNGGHSYKFNGFDDLTEDKKLVALSKDELDFFKNFGKDKV